MYVHLYCISRYTEFSTRGVGRTIYIDRETWFRNLFMKTCLYPKHGDRIDTQNMSIAIPMICLYPKYVDTKNMSIPKVCQYPKYIDTQNTSILDTQNLAIPKTFQI